MTILAGVVALEDTPVASLADRLAAASAYRADMTLCERYDSGRLSLRVLQGAGLNQVLRARTDAGEELFLIGRAVCAGGTADLQQRLRSAPEQTLDALDGYWIAVVHDPISGRVRLRSDPIGAAWLYLARDGRRLLFCSHFGALVRTLSFQPRLDEERAVTMLALNYTPDDGTCFREIMALPRGRFVTVAPEGLGYGEPPLPEYGDRFAGLSEGALFERLDGLYDEAMGQWLGGQVGGAVVSLSSGLDSRYGLALLLARGARPRCITFGHPRSRDVVDSCALCARAGLEHAVYVISDSDWDAWRAYVQRMGNVGGFQFSSGWAPPWLERLGALGSTILLGYLGDAYSGKHLVMSRGADWAANWLAWSLDEGRHTGWLDSPFLRRDRIGLLDVRARLDALMAQPAHVAFPHQRALHADVFGRQRRLVAAQTNVIADVLEAAPFFYTRGLLEFWANVDHAHLKGQGLYRRYAAARFPLVFAPRARPSIGRRVWGSSANAIGRFAPRIRQRLLASEIDLTRLLKRHRRPILELAQRLEPALAQFLDVRGLMEALGRFPGDRRINTVQLQRLTNLMLLLDAADSSIAESRHGSAPAALRAAVAP